jgi:hypothetical protein
MTFQPSTAMRICSTAVVVFAAGLASGAVAQAQSEPQAENGRYTMSAVPDGFLRLDTRTGAVSICRSKGGWTCRVVPDERTALDVEIGRLQADNKRLQDELAARDGTVTGKIDAPLAKEDAQKKSAQADKRDGTITLQLPADHDKLMAMVGRVWQQLLDMAARVQKQLSDKI